MIIPAYVPVGICKECGARVYAPESGGLPFMSSCTCGGGRKVVSAWERAKQTPRAGAEGVPKGKVKAA